MNVRESKGSLFILTEITVFYIEPSFLARQRLIDQGTVVLCLGLVDTSDQTYNSYSRARIKDEWIEFIIDNQRLYTIIPISLHEEFFSAGDVSFKFLGDDE